MGVEAAPQWASRARVPLARWGTSRGGGGGSSPSSSRPPTAGGGKSGFWTSRPATVVPSSSIELGGLQAAAAGAGAYQCWGEALGLPECPVSAREGGGGRPTTRDGGARPCTQDGGKRPSVAEQWWQNLGLEGPRPPTRDVARTTPQAGPGDLRLQQPLDGVRPSTREGARLQQMIEGSSGHRSARGVATAPLADGTAPQSQQQREQRELRILSRGPLTELRCQDPSLRQVAGRRKRPSHQTSRSPPLMTPREEVKELWASELLE